MVRAAVYSSTDVANLYLAKGSVKSLHDMIIYQSQTIYPLWNNMVDAVRWVYFTSCEFSLIIPPLKPANLNWELVPDKRGLTAEGSTSHNNCGEPRNSV